MNYQIRELEEFSVIGQKIELTKSKNKNVKISTKFWRIFNTNLKRAYLSQYGNWVKYAFMEKENGKLFYYCAIPKRMVVPEDFVLKKIKSGKYLVVEHTGPMDRIYETYTKLYQQVMSETKYTPSQTEFLHFEKYDYRFCWNKDNSIIEIWVPIEF